MVTIPATQRGHVTATTSLTSVSTRCIAAASFVSGLMTNHLNALRHTPMLTPWTAPPGPALASARVAADVGGATLPMVPSLARRASGTYHCRQAFHCVLWTSQLHVGTPKYAKLLTSNRVVAALLEGLSTEFKIRSERAWEQFSSTKTIHI